MKASGTPAQFDREYGCTEAEWRRWMPAAAGRPAAEAVNVLQVPVGAGVLSLEWAALPARVIGLISLPRLQVKFTFDTVSQAERDEFMARFNLYTQRGGG